MGLWWGLVRIGGINAACIGLGHVVGSGAGMGWVGLGVVIWGVLWVGVYSSSVVFVVVAWLSYGWVRVVVFPGGDWS